jgi:hypothetical protein
MSVQELANPAARSLYQAMIGAPGPEGRHVAAGLPVSRFWLPPGP